jgi:uncharacterized protein YutE (UPF0331/DUF86 family)
LKEEFKQRLLRYIGFLEEELQDYPKFKLLKHPDYIADRDKRRNVERWIENIINSSIDISKVILTLEGIALPDNYREIVSSISAIKELKAIDAEALSRWVRFRNIIAHEYLDLRWDSIERFIQQTEPLYKNFLEKVKGYIGKNLAGEVER